MSFVNLLFTTRFINALSPPGRGGSSRSIWDNVILVCKEGRNPRDQCSGVLEVVRRRHSYFGEMKV